MATIGRTGRAVEAVSDIIADHAAEAVNIRAADAKVVVDNIATALWGHYPQ